MVGLSHRLRWDLTIIVQCENDQTFKFLLMYNSDYQTNKGNFLINSFH